MDLNTNYIVEISKKVHPKLAISSDAVNYIIQLLTPYNQVLVGVTSYQSLLEWVSKAIPGALESHARYRITEAVKKITGTLDATKYDADPTVIAAAIQTLFYYLIAECLELAGHRARDDDRTEITPEDIQYIISLDKDLSMMFGITNDTKSVPGPFAITSEFITDILKQVHPTLTITNASIVYMMQLFAPYNEALVGVSSYNALSKWVDQAIPGELAKHANSWIMREVNKITAELETEYDTDPVVITAAVRVLFEYLIGECLELTGNKVRDVDDTEILPWDIQSTVGEDDDLSKMFGITKDMKTLPLTFVLQGNPSSVFEFSCEYATGFLLYTALQNPPWHLDFLGQQVTIAFTHDPYECHDPEARERQPKFQYSAQVDGKTYYFQTLDFLNGFKTAASWYTDNISNYLTDLRHYNAEGEATPFEMILS